MAEAAHGWTKTWIFTGEFYSRTWARYKSKSGQGLNEVQTHNEWKEQVHNVMEMYERRCWNSFMEQKDLSMVSHYRNANIEQGELRAYELVSELNEIYTTGTSRF